MTINDVSVQTRLDLITDYLGELKILNEFGADEIISDTYKYRATERFLELTIQASLDINRHLLKEIYQLEPKKNADVFAESSRVGILPKALGTKLSKAGKFRNLLAHLYDKVDPQQVVENIQPVLSDFQSYVDCINDYLDSIEAADEL